MARPSKAIFTYQTRLEESSFIESYATYMSTLERYIFAALQAKKGVNQLKVEFTKKFDISGRQFNSILKSVQGKISSVKALRPDYILGKQAKVKSLEKLLKKLSKLEQTKKIKLTIHQKNIRLNRIKRELATLLKDQQDDRTRLCFGSKKLFRKQFNLKENGYKDHAAWLKDWRFARNSELFFVGSKDETAGCQICQASLQENNKLTLKIRVPKALQDEFGANQYIRDVDFKYGKDVILASLVSKTVIKGPRKLPLKECTALTYRFKRDKTGWRLFVATEFKAPEVISLKQHGRIGVDVNVDHLAVVETDASGNVINSWTIGTNVYGKSSNQAKAILGDAAAKVLAIAKTAMKPVVVEKLDFKVKKRNLMKESPRIARMLSSFHYSSILQFIKATCFRAGIEVFEVNPAYTSIIGRIKFAARYGLTVHQGAALVIARRSQRFSETIPLLSRVPDNKGHLFSFDVPVRNRSKHVFCQLRAASAKLKTALAGQHRLELKLKSWSAITPLQ